MSDGSGNHKGGRPTGRTASELATLLGIAFDLYATEEHRPKALALLNSVMEALVGGEPVRRRDFFAGAALCGLCSNSYPSDGAAVSHVVATAAALADQLIDTLDG
jgi:hypothetical protein